MTTAPFRHHGDHVVLDLLGHDDAPWIAGLVDEFEAAVGRPWRELLERIDRLPMRVNNARRDVVVDALRQMVSGREPGAIRAADLRRHLLGGPALDLQSRSARCVAAATTVAMSIEQLEQAIWSDLPAERLVTMPGGRPSELALAARANLTIIQRALLRCHELRLRVSGNARAVVRTAAVRGLLATARMYGETVELDISGPLAMFHRTHVYGRALASIVPHLAWCEHFVLEAKCDLGRGPATFRIQPPILLPPSRAPNRYDSALEARFARDIAKHAPHWRAIREPSPVAAGAHLAFPDFMLEHRQPPHRRWWLEIVGFWTSDYLVHKLSTYRAANLPRVILCIDAQRSIADGDLPADARIVRFTKHVPIEQILAIVDG